MKERPILFSAPMVRAILDGTKTQTRRIVKPKPVWDTNSQPNGWSFQPGKTPGNGGLWKFKNDASFAEAMKSFSPYGNQGDRLWVRETWFDTAPFKHAPLFAGMPSRFAYRADRRTIGCHKWKPSIHMPRTACRIILEVTGMRVERLQDISEADCRAEGCSGGHGSIPGYGFHATPFEHYWQVWEQINGAGSWKDNPWVWVIEFRRVI